MGCLNVLVDADIVFLIVSIQRSQYFHLLKSVLNWRLLICEEVENEIEDPVSFSLKGQLIREGILDRFQPSNLQQAKEIAKTYKELRRMIQKGEASCYAIARYLGYAVLSNDHEAHRLLPPEIKLKITWFSFYEMLYLLNRKSAISDMEAQDCLNALENLPNFTLPVAIRKAGFSGIKAAYDKKYQT